MQGEWLWKIARLAVPGATRARPATTDPGEVNRRVGDLLARNPQVLRGDPNRLRPGQVLVVAETSAVDLSCDQVVPLGRADNGRTIEASPCTGIAVSLAERRTCGFAWEVREAPTS